MREECNVRDESNDIFFIETKCHTSNINADRKGTVLPSKRWWHTLTKLCRNCNNSPIAYNDDGSETMQNPCTKCLRRRWNPKIGQPRVRPNTRAFPMLDAPTCLGRLNPLAGSMGREQGELAWGLDAAEVRNSFIWEVRGDRNMMCGCACLTCDS